MSQQLNPYITFPGNAHEALDFYAQVLGGTAQVTTFRESGMDADGIMHGSLATPAGFHIFASDTVEGMQELKPGNNVQMSISGDEADTLQRYWDGLAEHGTVIVALEKQMWGDVYGQVVDRFGVLWHVNIATSEG